VLAKLQTWTAIGVRFGGRLEVPQPDQRPEPIPCRSKRALRGFRSCSGGRGERIEAGPAVDPSQRKPMFHLNLEPFGFGAALKQGEILGDRRIDLQKTVAVLSHAIDAPILGTTTRP
jgi:hypothetical protein